MYAVRVSELKNHLSSLLRRVRAGEELLIRDRNLPIAKIVPLDNDSMELDEISLITSGQMKLPKKRFNAEQFWSIGAGAKNSSRVRQAIARAIEAEREETDAGFLGHERPRSSVRSRSGK